MSHPNYILRGPVALLLASAMFTLASVPAHAGKELPPGEPLPPTPKFAANAKLAPAPAATAEQVLPPPVLQGPGDGGGQQPPVDPGAQLMPQQQSVGMSQNFAVNLINRLVQRGVLTKEDAADLIKQAEADSAIARTQAQTDAAAAAQQVVAQAVSAGQLNDPTPYPDDGSLQVTYIPEAVKRQIREELKSELLAGGMEVSSGPSMRLLPEWVKSIRLSADVRVRSENIYFPDGNDNTGAFPNFNAINTSAPFDVSGTVFSPQLNVDQDRYRLRLRVRVAAEVDISDGFTIGGRLVTGENNSPVSPNQSLGAAGNGQGGNFSKYAIWLDRGFLKYELGAQANKRLTVTGGRFDNPFFGTEIIWDDDLGFDGVALQAKREMWKGVTPFFNGGAFPVFNTDLNFSSNQPAKFESTDKWLYGAQLGIDLKPIKDVTVKIAGAYYYFDGVEGELSTPYTPLNANDAGDTDSHRPAFAQKGNTYMPLRRIIPNASNNFGTTNQFQYFGLASQFRPVAITGRIDYNGFEPLQISVIGEYIKNTGFDGQNVDTLAINNRGPNGINGTLGEFEGGDTAWIVALRAGHPAMQRRWDWQVGLSYRYVESDAVVDGFNDSDFGLGGTNLKGFTISGSLALSPRVALGLRWMSATEIAGPPLRADVLQIDISGKF